MITVEIRSVVRTLAAQGRPLREISRLLKLSRNTVRRILRGSEPPSERTCAAATRRQQIQPLFERAGGNVVRVQEMLAAEQGQPVPYSTITRWVREAELREPPKRSGEYDFGPASESQHDTSPHRVTIGEKTLTAQCAALVLAYSRRLYVQYYPRFTRLEAKHFLLEAARFMEGTCPVCVIDNSSVIVAGGSGAEALIAPEMAAFGRALGFAFRPHRLMHPDRKGRIERPFAWVETNFLPGRTFSDFDDLNRQALQWCTQIANQKTKRALGMSPEAAYVLEKPHLQGLPLALPPVYEVLERTVDLMGFVSVETNRYSVPERFVGKPVSVYQYPSELQIHCRGTLIATHPRLIGRREARQTLPEHHPYAPRAQRRMPAPEEKLLRGRHPTLDRYMAALTDSKPGRAVRALRRLLQIQQTYPAEPFIAALEQALRFNLFDLGRLERLVLKHVAGDFFALQDCRACEPTDNPSAADSNTPSDTGTPTPTDDKADT
jgi:transposase